MSSSSDTFPYETRLKPFFENDIGNIPLSAKLSGILLKKEGSFTKFLDMFDKYKLEIGDSPTLDEHQDEIRLLISAKLLLNPKHPKYKIETARKASTICKKFIK